MDPPSQPPDLPQGFPDNALDAQAFVEYERGQWVVYLDVFFWGETRRYRIEAYRTERRARVSAAYIERWAQRDLPGPPTGM